MARFSAWINNTMPKKQAEDALYHQLANATRALGWSNVFTTKFGKDIFPGTYNDPTYAAIQQSLSKVQNEVIMASTDTRSR